MSKTISIIISPLDDGDESTEFPLVQNSCNFIILLVLLQLALDQVFQFFNTFNEEQGRKD